MEKKIIVPDMHCDGCVKRINKALTEAGLTFSVSLESKTVTVSGDDNCVKKAADEIYDLGFTPEIKD